MVAVLESPKTNTQALSKIFNHLNKLERLETDVISLLPSLSDEEVMETRGYAKMLGKSAWKIEIACDAQIWERTRAACGRGNKDVDEEGIVAAVNKRAGELGCTGRTIYNNHRLYELFSKEIVETHFNHLDDKGFYLAASVAPDPHEAIEAFAQERIDNPTFIVKDAWRDAKRRRQKLIEKKNELAYQADNEKRKALRAHFDQTRLILEQRRDACAKLDTKLASQLYGAWIQEIVDQEDVWFVEDAKDAAIKAWHNGNTREDHMATALGLPLPEMHRIMKDLEEQGTFERSRQRGTDQARGPGQQLWHLVGEPIATYND